MEKRVAHYSLDSIKKLVEDEKYFITGTARVDFTEIGFTDEDVIAVVMSLEAKNLYKSMTSYKNNRIWQDVYHASSNNIDLYIKLQIAEDAIVISFKERS